MEGGNSHTFIIFFIIFNKYVHYIFLPVYCQLFKPVFLRVQMADSALRC